MSIKASTAVWDGSQHRSGDLIVLLVIADHADNEGKAYPGTRRIARKARLSQRHTRRCLNKLAASGELEILPNQAPSGGTLYKICLDKLDPDNLSAGTSTSGKRTPVSLRTDAHDRRSGSAYIEEEPSIESSEEPSSNIKMNISTRNNPNKQQHSHSPDAIGLVSLPKSGF
jgi:hypothetical protein